MGYATRSIPGCGISHRRYSGERENEWWRGDTMGLSLGIDIGGTFTDLVTMDQETGQMRLLKTPSIPEHPSRAVITGVEAMVAQFDIDPAAITYFVHGTTLALNTIIQRTGAPTGLLVTRGFADILELQRLRLPNPHHFNADRPQSLIPRNLVREIDERMLATGEVYSPLAIDSVIGSARELASLGVQAIAVCFLHAYRNPAHELAATEAIREACPQLYVCCTSEIWPQQREYERALITVINAYVGSKMRTYFDSLEREVSGLGMPSRVLSTKSNGGVMTARSAGETPVQTLLSGPASGVIGASFVGRLAGSERLLTFDMGGTSADIAVVNGEIALSTTNKAGDFPLIMPAVDVSSIGAGGGSVVWTDALGVLKVGPESAGADPGPACYGRGGTRPTVTDAYVVSGILDPARFLGGAMPLDADLARSAIATIGAHLGLSAEDAADAVLQVATSNMYAEFVPALAQHGVDPTEFALLPFGGAGPTHAFMLADEVGLKRVMVPCNPGTLCALGCLVADLRAEFVRTIFAECSRVPHETLPHAFAATEAEARAWLDAQDVAVDEITLLRSADMRYRGQSFEISVDLPRSADTGIDLAAAFHTRYKQIYGYADPTAEAEVINIRSTIIGRVRKPQMARIGRANGAVRPRGMRGVRYDGMTLEAAVLDRADLLAGARFEGPAVVEQYDTTTFVTPGWTVAVDVFGNLIAETSNDAH
jgi:N-methylhydantoinase A